MKTALSSDRPSFSIPAAYVETPFFVAPFVSERFKGQVLVKDETVTPIGSFKGRGAFHFCARQTRPGMNLVCASAGNFGQGMAVASRAHGCNITVFASNSANPVKVERMREFGAEVVQSGADFDEAKDAARQYARSHGARFVEDGAEDDITEGASSLGYEMLDARPDVTCVVLPLGNGALLCGVARAFRASGSRARIIGVTAEGAPAMALSWRARSVVAAPADTIADGIAVREPVPEIMAELYGCVDEIMEVSEEQLRNAVCEVFRHHSVITEPAGAAGVAALLAYPEHFDGLTVATALCGGNISPELRLELFGQRVEHGSEKGATARRRDTASSLRNGAGSSSR